MQLEQLDHRVQQVVPVELLVVLVLQDQKVTQGILAVPLVLQVQQEI